MTTTSYTLVFPLNFDKDIDDKHYPFSFLFEDKKQIVFNGLTMGQMFLKSNLDQNYAPWEQKDGVNMNLTEDSDDLYDDDLDDNSCTVSSFSKL